jgi:hypothetical protein
MKMEKFMDNMNIKQYTVSLNSYINQQVSFRKGQAIMNHLAMVRPDLANKIVGTQMDCFYTDDRIQNCLNFIYQNWENENV